MTQIVINNVHTQALAALQQGKFAEARDLLAPLLMSGDDSEALRLLALIQVRENCPHDAVRTLQRALLIERSLSILANLANAYVYAGDNGQAEIICREALAIGITPEVCNTLGSLLAMRKIYPEAQAMFERALALRPDYVQAHCNLANVFFLSGQIEKAFLGVQRLVGWAPHGSEDSIDNALTILLQHCRQTALPSGEALNTLKELAYLVLPVCDWEGWSQLLICAPCTRELKYEAYLRSAIYHHLQDAYSACQEALREARILREQGLILSKGILSLGSYEGYLTELMKTMVGTNADNATKLIVLGDSHVLSWHGQRVRLQGTSYRLVSELVMGGKAFHIAEVETNRFNWRLRQMLRKVPPGTPLIFSFGEIDCRIDEGILPYLRKTGRPLEEVVSMQTHAYAQAIKALLPTGNPMAWLIGVPAPNLTILQAVHSQRTAQEWEQLCKLIRLWNCTLADACRREGLGFIDIYTLTAAPNGGSNSLWHCDSVHLGPGAIVAARWHTHETGDVRRLVDEMEQGAQAIAQNRLLDAERTYRKVITAAPHTPEAHNNLGTVLREQGRINEARVCFERALTLRPDYAVAHSNLLFALHYIPGQTLAGLRAAHEDWARTQLAGLSAFTHLPQPKTNVPLTVGLVSPDLYYHPVGVFLLPWLQHHDRQRFRLVAYADGSRVDTMTDMLRAHVDGWRAIAGTDDEEVCKQIRQDGVDILIDLAGHTAGNRLKLFARRAASVQISWLGYASTTAVPAMDAVLMDGYSAPPGTEAHFTEKLVRLDGLRFCYTPPAYAPAVVPAPTLHNGYVTFGSFNNLAKLSPEVMSTWAEILQRVPHARLVLKWKALGDAQTRQHIQKTFAALGIAPERIDCRGWSNHPTMLAEYGDIDIALDPFHFSGGLTSCDALYMGVPVLTLPGVLPISRQTGSYLHALGLTDWITRDREDYATRAVHWAGVPARLEELRAGLRERMLASRLCNGADYALSIENALAELLPARENTPFPNRIEPSMQKTFLHIGCGLKRKDQTTRGFNTSEWQELRFDIDESVRPDLVGTMTDMSAVPSESVDAIFSSHNIEHLYPHEVPKALAEFKRVLKPDGFAIITCPDLQSVCVLVAENKLTEPAYVSSAGPITPLDILYGHRPALARGNLFMAHRCGFTQKDLIDTLQAAGFTMVASQGRQAAFDLWALATVSKMDQDALRALAGAHFPG